MIIDFHTHIFPPEVRDNRDYYIARDAAFAEMYTNPKAKIATAKDLIVSMDKSEVDMSVAMGFAWRDQAICQLHNDYILEAASISNGRILPFCMVNPAAGETAAREIERCASAGSRGLGELRPDNQGYDLAKSKAGELLAAAAEEYCQILLFHVTEPDGHSYPGKQGLRLANFRDFIAKNTNISIVGGHFAGGLPIHNEGPANDLRNTYLDTAAMPYLYDESIIPPSLSTLPGRVLMGSDWPLITQGRQIKLIRSSVNTNIAKDILGSNAIRLLDL